MASMEHGLQISLKRDARAFDGNWARYELWVRPRETYMSLTERLPSSADS